MPKKPVPYKKIILYTGIAFLFLISLGVGYAVNLYNKTADVITESHEEVGRAGETSQLREDVIDPIEDNVSILFIGIDDSKHRDFGEGSRSDALLLATFNKSDSTVKILSIPRDSYVYIPEVDYSSKINHAHSFGGPKAAMETVEEFLHVPVDYFVRMNFEAFIDVVDSLNGITIDVPYELKEMDSNDKKNAIHLYPGMQSLNGEEALAFVRTRKYDSDIERGQRQQEVIKKIAKKATSVSSIFKLDEVISAVGENMITNLSFSEMQSFLSYGLDKQFSIETISLDGDGGFMDNGGWYFQVDEISRAKIQQELREHLDLGIHQINDFAEEGGYISY